MCSHLAILFSDSGNFWLLDSSRSGNVEKGKKPGCLSVLRFLCCGSTSYERTECLRRNLALRQRWFLAKSGNNPLPKHSRTCWNWSEFLDCVSWEEVASKFTGSEGRRFRGLRCSENSVVVAVVVFVVLVARSHGNIISVASLSSRYFELKLLLALVFILLLHLLLPVTAVDIVRGPASSDSQGAELWRLCCSSGDLQWSWRWTGED